MWEAYHGNYMVAKICEEKDGFRIGIPSRNSATACPGYDFVAFENRNCRLQMEALTNGATLLPNWTDPAQTWRRSLRSHCPLITSRMEENSANEEAMYGLTRKTSLTSFTSSGWIPAMKMLRNILRIHLLQKKRLKISSVSMRKSSFKGLQKSWQRISRSCSFGRDYQSL